MDSVFFFFFSSRRRHTRWNCDWSSDVCSSDLIQSAKTVDISVVGATTEISTVLADWISKSKFAVSESRWVKLKLNLPCTQRSEERRVGKECRYRSEPDP